VTPGLQATDDAGPSAGEPLVRGEFVRLAFRLGRSLATGLLTVDSDRGGPLVLRRGALVAAPTDERGTQARTRLARLAAIDAGRWWFDGGSAPYPPGATVTVPLAAWARQHLEAQLDSGRADALTAELAGRRLALVADHQLPADLLDEAEHDGGEAGRRAAHLERGAAEEADDDAAGHGGDDAGQDRRAAGERDPEGQGEGHEEHDEGGGEVTRERVAGGGVASGRGGGHGGLRWGSERRATTRLESARGGRA